MQEPKISVGITTKEEIHFILNNKYSLRGNSNFISGKHTASIVENKICIQSENEKTYYKDIIQFEPDDIGVDGFEIQEVKIGIDFHWEKTENQQFQGALKIQLHNNQLVAINILPLELYLKSVIASEMSANSSLELLKSHAIISRSWLIAQMQKKNKIRENEVDYQSGIITENELIKWYDREDHDLFDVCADDHCQRYQGITKISNTNVIEALNSTYGKVLLYQNEVCDTRFSKCCGGVSESYENVWEDISIPYLTKVVDGKNNNNETSVDLTNEENANKWIMEKPKAFCNTEDNQVLDQILMDYDRNFTGFFRWKIEYNQQDLQKLIAKKLNMDFGNIISLSPIKRGESGRLIKLQIVGDKKSLVIGKELEIRRALSESHLYSSAIVIEKSDIRNNIPQKFTIYGAGWGHGVGLCQIGAAVMGEKGYTHEEILYHYFKDTQIEIIY